MTSILSTTRHRRTIAVAAVIAALAPAGVALAGPDTNIQKPGHRTLADPDTNIQKPGHVTLALDDPDTNIQKPGHVSISRPLGDA